MKLHRDEDAFRVIIDNIHNETGYRADVLEKDYYVVLILQELAEKQNSGLKAYFKGGTALYKALKTTNRFSEDVDLSVDVRECSRTQNDKRLEAATKKYNVLPRDATKGKTNRSEVVSIYKYNPLTSYDSDDILQRFGQIKIEATSFTISEPIEDLEVSSLIYDLASNEQKTILDTRYDVRPFYVKTMTLERIFIDKLFAAECYVRKSENPHKAFEAAKHIYDLCLIEEHPKIVKLMDDEKEMQYLLDVRTTEEMNRLDGIHGVNPSEFFFFESVIKNDAVRSAYEIMQKQYVLRSQDRIEFDSVCESLGRLKERLFGNFAWKHYRVYQPVILQKETDINKSNMSNNTMTKRKNTEIER